MSITVSATQLKRKQYKDRVSRYKGSGISVDRRFWDWETHRIADSHPKSELYNQLLDAIIEVFKRRALKLQERGNPSLGELKQELSKVVGQCRSQELKKASSF